MVECGRMGPHRSQYGREARVVRLPDFFVVGAAKAATTSLFEMLRGLQGFGLTEPKEPGFFVYDRKTWIISARNPTPTEVPYLVTAGDFDRVFGGIPQDRLFGDFTTHYLYHADRFIQAVQAHYGAEAVNVPIIVVLRHPVDRAYSHYMMKVRDGHEYLQFLEAIRPEVIEGRLSSGFIPSFDYLGFSRYEHSVRALEACFDDVLLVDYTDLLEEPRAIGARVCRFLGVSIDLSQLPELLPQHNASGTAKRGWLNRFCFHALYRPNTLKAAVPSRLRRRLGRLLKASIGKRILQKSPMSDALRKAIAPQLASEIAFFHDRVGNRLEGLRRQGDSSDGD